MVPNIHHPKTIVHDTKSIIVFYPGEILHNAGIICIHAWKYHLFTEGVAYIRYCHSFTE